jgi:hypothetical protein
VGNDPGTTASGRVLGTQQAGVYRCINPDCAWAERDRVAAISRERINVGQGLFLVAAVRCECDATLTDQGGPST